MKHHPKKPHNFNLSDDAVRLISAVLISFVVLYIFNHFFEGPRKAALEKEAAAKNAPVTTVGGAVVEAVKIRTRDEVLKDSARVEIRGKKVTGSISLKGARLDDLFLKDHYATIEKTQQVALLSPSGAEHAYYAEDGWAADRESTIALPGADAVWQLDPSSPRALESGGAVTLVWDNGNGFQFEKRIALDDNYLFTVSNKVTNQGKEKVGLYPYHLIARQGLPVDFMGFAILHEGPIAWLDGKLHEIKYGNLEKEEVSIQSSGDGWAGMSDKYWFVSVIPTKPKTMTTRAFSTESDKGEASRYQVDVIGDKMILEPGATLSDEARVFVGAKDLDMLNSYQKTIPHFNLVLDFGMWWFLTKPLFYLLNMLDALLGHIGLAILGLTVVVRAIVFPLASKSFRSMAAFKKVAPQLQELQNKHKNDKKKLQEEIFQLYKREDVNPFSGCWPMFIQIPIFFSLYKVIMISIDMRHAPFWGWINDLSAPDPTTIFNLFGLIPWTPPSMLMIGAWPCIMGITMWLQQRMSPPPPDPAQRQLFALMPFFITFMLSKFAVGLVIYWAWGNVLSIFQQYYIMRSSGVEVTLLHGHGERRELKKKEKAERKSRKHGKSDQGA